MSVTNILSYSNQQFKEFRATLAEFKKPRINTEKYKIKAVAQSDNYAIVGTAFDYLLRFTIEKHYKSKVKNCTWVAENAINMLNPSVIYDNPNSGDIDSLLERNAILINDIRSRFEYIKKIFYTNYIHGYKSLDIDILKSCLFLAKLDTIVRAGLWHLYRIDFFNESDEDIRDLKTLIEICDINIFRPTKSISLNPTFGNASRLVRGADADLIVDNMLIDIKTVNQLKIKREYYNQVIIYYLLHLIEKLESKSEPTINKLGFYFARFGLLFRIPIDTIGTPEEFMKAIDVLKRSLNNR